MIWWLIIVTVFAVLAFLLTAPIVVDIHSREARYEIRFGSVIRLRIVPTESQIRLCLSVFGLSFSYDPFRANVGSTRRKDEGKRRNTWRPRLSAADALRKAKQFVQSVEVRWLEADLDTDDYIANAILFPIAYFGSADNRRLRINFEGTISLRLRLVTTGSRIVAAILT